MKSNFFKTYMAWVVNLGQSMHYIQAYKIYTNRSSENISLTAYIIGLILLLHWLIYGIIIKDKVIISAETLGIIGVSLILLGTQIYP